MNTDTGKFLPVFYPCLSVSISIQGVKARINKGFLDAMDGHCQWNCQHGAG
jgi:hypothetical protein